MELIAQIGMVLLFVFTAITILLCAFCVFKLVNGLKAEYKYIAPIFGPFAFCMNKFFHETARPYLLKLWISVLLLVVSAGLTFYFGKSCFPEGIAVYACENT